MTPEVEKKFQSAQWKFIIGSMITYAFFYLTRKNLSMAQPLMLEEGVISTTLSEQCSRSMVSYMV